MPDNKNQNQNQKGFEREQQGNRGTEQGGREQQGNRGSQQGGREQQGNRGSQQGGKSSTHIENEDVRQVGNDNDLDRDLEDADEDVITQRNPRMNDRGEQGQMDRGGQGGMDRDRNR
jgi:hypothetical protein